MTKRRQTKIHTYRHSGSMRTRHHCITGNIPAEKVHKNQKENPTAKESPQIPREAHGISNKDSITQTVQDLSVPNYDEKGKEVLVMRGKSTYLLSNNIYKIIEPEIEVMDSESAENGTQSVLITSDSGEMNNTSNEGYLSDNVVVHLDPETQLNTDYLRYLPEKSMCIQTIP